MEHVQEPQGEQVEPPGIILPRYLSNYSPGALFSICRQIELAGDPVILDGRHVVFIDPLGLAVLCSALEPLQKSVRFDWFSLDLTGYMERMTSGLAWSS